MTEIKKTPIQSVPFHRIVIGEEEEKAVLEVLHSGWLTTGKWTKQFEEDFSNFLNSGDGEYSQTGKKVISLAVNSNTNGMILAMYASGVGEGKAIITSPYSFVSTALSATHLGADVYFADTKKGTFNIDPVEVEKILAEDEKNGKRVVAIVPVHVMGVPAEMSSLLLLAKRYNVKIIEDAAHSFPSRTQLGYAGTIGDAGVFSFYATKTITTGEGGMVTTRDAELAKKIEIMRLHGIDRPAWDRYTNATASWKYDVVAPGFKSNLPDILSAIGVGQLKRANEFLARRTEISKLYNASFSQCDFIEPPPTAQGDSHHIYPLCLKLDKLSIDRDEFFSLLQAEGVGVSVHFIPLFHFTFWKNLYKNFRSELFPNAEEQFKKTISLPIFPSMTREEVEFVISKVRKIGNAHYAKN